MCEVPKSAWSGQRVRKEFIKFYQDRGHINVPSSSVVPEDDPTLLFANAGMNQFKPIFLGTVDPQSSMGQLKRAVNSQKCIRAGGKHNDLDDVGKDTYHHTFFEMMGTWSFGDYFKEDSIRWAWELLTQVYGLNKERIYVTYFKGNPEQNLLPDEEARQIWSKFLPSERILPFGMKENFWEMGETGPCGPCSEIHYDRIGGRDGSHLVNKDDPSVIEIWNHVFIQFNRESNGQLVPLPSKHVDTGLGLERLVSILQEVSSNYDTDLFRPIFDTIQKVYQCPPYGGCFGVDDPEHIDMAYRVIADHIRTLTFSITDGAKPSNVGQGYVIRKVLRRAIRYGKQILKGQPGFLSQIVPSVIKIFSESPCSIPSVPVGAYSEIYPNLNQRSELVMSTIRDEELMFIKNLEKGTRKFNQMVSKLTTKVIPGEKAWVLYDTYGLPLDITCIMAGEKGLTVDVEGYEHFKKFASQVSQSINSK